MSAADRRSVFVGTAVLLAVLALLVGLMVGHAAGLNLASQTLTPYRTCVITATPASTTAVVDASVRQGTANGNFGTTNTVDIASTNAANRRLYLRFDLTVCSPAIPATATVRLATLRLYATALSAACRTIDLFRVTAAWTETTLTWVNQPFGTTLNNPASGTAVDTFTLGTPAGCQNQATGIYMVGANPTADVAAFVAGSATNNGWMLRDDVEGSATARTETFSAKDLGTLAQAPQLVITYVLVP
jgi:hypothetical protein